MLLALKETWMTSFGGFFTFHEDSLPWPVSLDAERTLWQRKWDGQDPKTAPTTASVTLKEIDHAMYPNITAYIFHLSSHHMRVWKECVGFEATKNIFTKHDVTDEIARSCLAVHSLQRGQWLSRNNSQICKASSKENVTDKYIVSLTEKARKGHFR